MNKATWLPWGLFGLLSVLALYLGFFAFSPEASLLWVSRLGYWAVLAGFLLWLFALGRVAQGHINEQGWPRPDWRLVAVVALGAVVMYTQERFEFKIQNDELLLLSTSMDMHFNRSCLTPYGGHEFNGIFSFTQRYLDKRPLFHPFLLSLVHDLTGYRPENAFVLNGFLGVGFLGLLAHLGRRVAGLFGGLLSVSLFIGLPLYAQNACGAGFDLLNLCMVGLYCWLFILWYERRDGPHLVALAFTVLLLVQTRYESVVLVVPFPVVLLLDCLRRRAPLFDWRFCLVPLLLVPYALQHQVFNAGFDTYEMLSKSGVESPFSLSLIPANLIHAFTFFFSLPDQQANAPFFSALAWLSMPFCLLGLLRLLQGRLRLSLQDQAFAWLWVGLALHFVFLMSYFWGQFDDTIIRRLSLPTHLWFLLSIWLVHQFYPQVRRFLLPATLGAGVAVLVFAVPALAKRSYMQQYSQIPLTNARRDFVSEQVRKDYLVVDNDSFFWLTHGVSGLNYESALKSRAFLEFHLKNSSFSGIYVSQQFQVKPETGAWDLPQDQNLGPDFVLEPVFEQRISVFRVLRISRIVRIQSEGGVIAPQTFPLGQSLPLSSDQADAARLEYLANYFKRLP